MIEKHYNQIEKVAYLYLKLITLIKSCLKILIRNMIQHGFLWNKIFNFSDNLSTNVNVIFFTVTVVLINLYSFNYWQLYRNNQVTFVIIYMYIFLSNVLFLLTSDLFKFLQKKKNTRYLRPLNVRIRLIFYA